MKKVLMNIFHFRLIRCNLKIFGEIRHSLAYEFWVLFCTLRTAAAILILVLKYQTTVLKSFQCYEIEWIEKFLAKHLSTWS